MNEDSILDSIKKQLNIGSDYTAFDPDIILLINSAFATLHQLGIGPDEGFSIEDSGAEWSDFYDDPRLNGVRRFVYLKVRVVFDPPIGSIMTSFENQIKEEEWRLIVAQEDINRETQ